MTDYANVSYGDTIPTGEAVKRATNIDVDAKLIHALTTVKRDKNSPAIYVSWSFDYSKLSEQQLVELAARSLKIDAQRAYRADPKPGDEWNERTFVLPDDLATRTRQPRAPKPADLAAYLKTLSAEEREAFLADALGEE